MLTSAAQCVLEWAVGVLAVDSVIGPALALLDPADADAGPAIYEMAKPLGAQHPCAVVWIDLDAVGMAMGEVYQDNDVRFRITFHDEGPDYKNLIPLRNRASSEDCFRGASAETALGSISTVCWEQEFPFGREYIAAKPYVGGGDFYTTSVQAAEV